MDGSLLKLENVNSILNSEKGPVYVLNDICLDLIKGSIVGLIGESGSGKTQLCLASTGMQDLTPGVVNGNVTIHTDKSSVKVYPEGDLNSKHIFKDINNNYKRKNSISYDRNVYKRTKSIKTDVIGWIPQDPRNFLNPFWKMNRFFKESYNSVNIDKDKFADISSFIKYYLDQVDLDYEDIKDKYPHEMSGGECQRAMIAFILSKNPNFIIADETTTGLDVSRQKKVIDLFKSIKNNNPELTIIFVSHDFGFLDHLVDQYLVMYGGFLVEKINNKSRLKDSIDSLHPYTQDLLFRLFDKHDEGYDELASSVNLHKKLDSCPYVSSCKYLGKNSKFESKCHSEIPPIVKVESNSDLEFNDLEWQRCWREIE